MLTMILEEILRKQQRGLKVDFLGFRKARNARKSRVMRARKRDHVRPQSDSILHQIFLRYRSRERWQRH